MTTLPLVERWGFLRQPGAELAFPTEAEIGELHARVGWRSWRFPLRRKSASCTPGSAGGTLQSTTAGMFASHAME